MNLKKRMILSNTSVVLIPVVITAVLGSLFIYLSYTLGRSGFDYENVQKISKIQTELFMSGETIFKESSETLARSEFQQYLSSKLADISAQVAVIKNKELVYSTITLNAIDIENVLSADAGMFTGKSIRFGSVTYLLKTYPFNHPVDTTWHIFIFVPVTRDDIDAGWFVVFIAIVFLLSFLVTNVIYSIKLSKSIAVPLSKLKEGVLEIIGGNLGFQITEEGDEEIREVLRALEQMRLKLEESVYTKLKYDENRKMLVSSISHDLKTPITSIKGYVEGILDGVANSREKQDKYLKTIYTKAALVDSMIDDLILYSKLDLDQIPFDFEVTDIDQYLKDCMDENEPEFEKLSISSEYTNTLSLKVFVFIDREKLRRVIQNLIGNAIKYLHPERIGEIKLILRQTKDTIIIEVSDNGIGIPKESLPFVFDRFYRADKARSSVQGSGLGLAIAKRIIEGHKGSIWINSREDKGTSLMISLNKYNGRGVS